MKNTIYIILCSIFFSLNLQSQPLQNHLMIAVSNDGLTFSKLNKILYEFADVPDAVVVSSKVYVYFQGIIGQLHNVITVGISENGIDNWSFQPIKINGIEGWLVRPCDPDVVYQNGIFRLYFTGDPKDDGIPETYSAVSTDGINFNLEEGIRFSGGNFRVLDPSLLWIGDTLHFFAGGKDPTTNWHAVSTDGLNFHQVDDFFTNGMMMSNGIRAGELYRFYGFQNTPPQNIRSIYTYDGRVWYPDPGFRLELDKSSSNENIYVKDPAIIFKDSIYIMYYVTRKKEYSEVEHFEGSSPEKIELPQNNPNPFTATTTIRFSLPQYSHVRLKVYDSLGREIATLVDGELNPGEHSVVYNAEGLPSGVYFYQLITEKFSQTNKMVLLR